MPLAIQLHQAILADERQRIVKGGNDKKPHLRPGHICCIIGPRWLLVARESLVIAAYMAHLSISLFGSFQVALDGRPVTDFGTDKTRALLAYLAVETDHPHRRDALAGLLWPERPQAKARQSLRQALTHLRQALGNQDGAHPFLSISRETVQFSPDGDYWLDTAQFTSLARTSREHSHRRPDGCLPCIWRMEEMARLYGPFLGDFFLGDSYAFEEWAALQREYLQRQMMEALAYLGEYCQRRGDVGQAIRLAHQQVAIEPWREEAHRQLMRLMALDGQRSAALAQYQVCQELLASELGVEPTAETTALYDQIRAQESEAARNPGAFPAQPHNLPVTATPFIGREEELVELAELVANPDCRLVTVIGPGGIGKTRLALKVAADHMGLMAHGIAFVPLASVDSADLLVPTIADALPFRFHSQGDPEEQLLDYLQEKELLLLFDNMEHLLGGADTLSKILHHAPEVMLLVTSRERLNLREEWVYELEGLPIPLEPTAGDWQTNSAVALFVDSARRVHRKFGLSEEVAPCVTRICQMVEGMPLALELAAAWIPLRTCEEVACDLERNLDVLSTRLRNVPQRHRSLRAALEHSWHLLTEPERTVLQQLSVFRAGFTEEAAARVAGASPTELSALVDKSLLRRGISGRYDMHRLLRQYAEEKLRDAAQQQQAVEDLLCEYYSGFLQEREAWLRGPRQAEALEQIAAEIDNVRFACRLGVARGKVEAMERSLNSLGAFYAIRSWHQEGARVFGRAAEHLGSHSPQIEGGSSARREPVLGACLAWQGHFRYQLGDYEAAHRLLESSLEILDGHDARAEKAFSLYTLGQILCFGKNDYPEAGWLFEESLALYQALGDLYGQAQCLDGLGDIAVRQGDHKLARRQYEEGLTLRRQIGDLWGLSVSLGSLGGLAGRLGAYGEARERFEESLALCRQVENPRGIAASLHNLSTVAYLQQEYAEAKRFRLEALDLCREIGYRWGIASSLKSLGDVACRLGEYAKAQRFLSESLVLLQEAGDRRSEAYTLNSLGMVAQTLGKRQEARQHFQRALEAAMEIQEPALALDVLMSLARGMADEGEAEQALELLAFVLHHPASEQQTKDRSEPLHAELASRLASQAAAETEARGRSMDLQGVASRLLGS